LNLPLAEGGSLTLRRRKKKKGLESDNCYWIQNEHLVRAKKRIYLQKDPPPDVAIEADITRSSLNRMGIYVALKVPEIWRYRRRTLTFHILQADGKYAVEEQSRAFPGLKSQDLVPFLENLEQLGANEVIRQFRVWVRQHLLKTP